MAFNLSNYTQQQLEIIESFGLGQAVVAGAGCGKTTTLVGKCLALLKRNPEARFCAVSYTEKSAADLRQSLAKALLEEGLLDEDHERHWIKTLHSLCISVIQEFPQAAGLTGGERVLDEAEAGRLWLRSLQPLWTSAESGAVQEALFSLRDQFSKSTIEGMIQKFRDLNAFGLESAVRSDHPVQSQVWTLFQSVQRRYENQKNRIGALDFSDLETRADRALQDPKASERFRRRFDLVLVDEFQDTNPLQGKILERFARPEMSNLCLVGDPKQSIYRFRDADVTMFLELSDRLPKKHLLTTNYRSRAEIIDFVNTVCEKPFEASSMPYEALVAGRPAAGQSCVNRLEIDQPLELGNYLRTKMNEGVDLAEFVILGRSLKSKMRPFLDALDLYEIPYVLGSGGGFFEDVRILELISFLRGWASPANVESQWTALRSTWIGVEENTLYTWRDRPLIHFFESAHPLACAYRDRNITPERRSSLRPGEVLQVLSEVFPDDHELVLPIATLWHRCEAASSQGLSFEDVVAELDRAIQEEHRSSHIPAPAVQGAVRIMTVHGSKGLQFPRVILVGFDPGAHRKPSGKSNIIWNRKRGLFIKDKEDPDYGSWVEAEAREELAESKRVFYVALTRAQEELILVWPKKNSTKAPAANVFLKDCWRDWVATVALPPALPPIPMIPPPETAQGATGPVLLKTPPLPWREVVGFRPRHSPSEWRILEQCRRRYFYQWIEPQNLPQVVPAERKASSKKESASEVGERIHAALEHERWNELDQFFGRGNSVVSPLQQILTVDRETTVYRELAFECPLDHEQALTGMMDRLEVNQTKKTIRVRDYKWTQKNKSATELLDDYGVQLQIYLWAAIRLVGFVPNEVSAELIHLCPDGLQRVAMPTEDLAISVLDRKISELWEHAQGISSQNLGTTGDHCQTCSYQMLCPEYQKN